MHWKITAIAAWSPETAPCVLNVGAPNPEIFLDMPTGLYTFESKPDIERIHIQSAGFPICSSSTMNGFSLIKRSVVLKLPFSSLKSDMS